MNHNLSDLYRLVLKHNWRVIKTERQDYGYIFIITVWIEPPEGNGFRHLILRLRDMHGR